MVKQLLNLKEKKILRKMKGKYKKSSKRKRKM
jgi:hypothetical protein